MSVEYMAVSEMCLEVVNGNYLVGSLSTIAHFTHFERIRNLKHSVAV